MPSSISNSDQQTQIAAPAGRAAWLRASAVLLALIILIVGIFEFAARVVVPRISRVEGRTNTEYASMFLPRKDGRPVAVFLGNSLLGAAVDFDRFSAQTAGRIESRRFFVDNTAYYDWYYGLRRLFSEGARPQVVYLMLSDVQLLANTVRGDYFAYRLMNTTDVVDVARTLDVHPTDAAGYAFASVSAFYGTRAEIRKVILGRMMPDLPDLTSKLIPSPIAKVPGEELFAVGPGRLRDLDRLCSAHGAKFVLLPPPQLRDSGARLKRVASLAGVQALAPFKDEDYKEHHFSDGFHLNESGTAMYTEQLMRAILSGSF